METLCKTTITTNIHTTRTTERDRERGRGRKLERAKKITLIIGQKPQNFARCENSGEKFHSPMFGCSASVRHVQWNRHCNRFWVTYVFFDYSSAHCVECLWYQTKSNLAIWNLADKRDAIWLHGIVSFSFIEFFFRLWIGLIWSSGHLCMIQSAHLIWFSFFRLDEHFFPVPLHNFYYSISHLWWIHLEWYEDWFVYVVLNVPQFRFH